jgi:hypothetical protein
MAKKRHWLKDLFSFKRQVRLNNHNKILEDSTILFESKKRKSIYMFKNSKKLLIEVSTYGKEYLVKLYKFSKKGLKLISQKSCLGNEKLKKVIKCLLLGIGLSINLFFNIGSERIDHYVNSNPQNSTEIHRVMNSINRWPFIIESKNSMISNFEIEHTNESLSLILSIKGGSDKNLDHQSLSAQTIRAFKQVIKVLKSEKLVNVIWEASVIYHKASNAEAQGKTSLRLNIDPRIESPLQNFDKSTFSEKSLAYLEDDITNHLGKSNSALQKQTTNLKKTPRQKSVKGKTEIQRHESRRLRYPEDFEKLNFEQAMQLAERSGKSPTKIESRQKAGVRSKPEKGKNHGSTSIGVAEALVSPLPRSPYAQRQEAPFNPFLTRKEGLNSNSLHRAGEKAKQKQNQIVGNRPTNLKESSDSNLSPNEAPITKAKILSPSENHHRRFTIDDLQKSFEQAALVNPNYGKLNPAQKDEKIRDLISHSNSNHPTDDRLKNEFSSTSVGEAITALQGEAKGLIQDPERFDPAIFKPGQQGVDFTVKGPDNVRIADAKAATYTGETPEELEQIAKKNGKKIVKQMDLYTNQDPDKIQ